MTSPSTTSRCIGSLRAPVWLAVAGLMLVGALPAQWGYLQRQQQTTSQASRSVWAPPPQWASPLAPPSATATVPPPYRPGFQGLKSTAPSYQSFPAYPQGYGPPPRVGGFLPQDSPDPASGDWTPPALPRSDSGSWPSWIETGVPELEKRASPERAALARTADRVWFLAPDDTAFIPLSFYDKFRVIDSGTFVEVRNKGEFQVAFHDGAWMRSIGAVRLGLPRLSSTLGELQLNDFRRLWLHAKTRTLKVLLPEGSVLELAGTDLYLERDGARGLVFNNGSRAIRWISRVGEREIPPAHRIEIFLTGENAPYRASALQLEGAVRAEPDGRNVEVHGEPGGGAVTWSGARFRLDGGAVVRIDPLAGAGFPETVK